MGRYTNPLRPKKEKTPTYQYTAEMLRAEIRDAVKEGIAAGMYIANATYSAALLIALRDKLGFGVKRLRRIFDYVQQLFEEKIESRITDTDLLQSLYDECGITLEVFKPDGVTENAMDLFRELETKVAVRMQTEKRR